MKKIILWVCILLVFTACKKDKDNIVVELQKDVRYTFSVSLKGHWSEKTHPNYFPTDAKFGKTLAISHYGNNVLFEQGNKAEMWLKSYIETGDTNSFTSYFNEFKNVDKVDAIVIADSFSPEGDITFEFTTIGKTDLFSFVTSLSPSPDWFVGVNNINLNRLAHGGSLVFITKVWDAGLFSGNSATDKGNATSENITVKNNSPLSIPNGGVNNFMTITISYQKSEKIK